MLQDRQFIVQGSVEHAVRVFLIGKDVLFLTAADAGPDFERLFGRIGAELLITHDAAQQADVRGPDAVVVIQVQAGEGTDEYLVDFIGGQHFADLGIQAVDAFQDDDLTGNQRGRRSEVILFAGFEIVFRHENLFTVQQGVERFRKELDIQRVDGFKVARSVNLQGKICMDVGASTGGFTDCMLQNGAKKVYAVDVGYGQLHWKLRNDERVVNLEKTNVRYITKEQVPEEIGFFSVDVSFISLTKVLGPVKDLLRPDAEAVALIKPQFEAGRKERGRA